MQNENMGLFLYNHSEFRDSNNKALNSMQDPVLLHRLQAHEAHSGNSNIASHDTKYNEEAEAGRDRIFIKLDHTVLLL